MNNKNSKTRTLRITTVVTGCEKETFLKCIQLEEGLLQCVIKGDHLTLKYDLDKTTLESLMSNIKPMLRSCGIKLKNGFINKFKTEFIYFIETNQRDNIDKLSGWHLRLQNLYLDQATITRHIRENSDIKITAHNIVPDQDRNMIYLNTDRYTDLNNNG